MSSAWGASPPPPPAAGAAALSLRSLRADRFGRLRGTVRFAEDQRCNILCQDNEFGKTTLLEALLYTLYGFPTAGYKKGEMRPRERYEPWGEAGAPMPFRTWLELTDQRGRNLRLSADFHRQQPFTLIEEQSGEAIPLDGQSYGQRFFRMSLASFTECFFFRQDERERTGTDELVRLIEETAASNEHRQAPSVRGACAALRETRVHVPEFSAGPINIDSLLKKLADQAATLRRQAEALERERAARAGEIAAAAVLDGEIAGLAEEQLCLEHDCLLLELRELEAAEARRAELERARAEMAERIGRLEVFAGMDASRAPAAEAAFARWRAARDGAAAVRRRLEDEILPALDTAETELERYPKGVQAASQSELDRLRTLADLLHTAMGQLEDQQASVDALRQDLEAEGINLAELQVLNARLAAMSDEERQFVFAFDGTRGDLEAAAARAEHEAGAAGLAAAQAKARREHYGTWAGALGVLGVVAVVAALVLALISFPKIAAASGVIGVLALVGAAIQVQQSGWVARHVMQPAAAALVEHSGEINRVKERLERLRTRLEEIGWRHSLDEEQLRQLQQSAQWSRLMAPWQAAAEQAIRQARELAQYRAEAAALLRRLGLHRSATPEELDAEALGQAAHVLEEALALRTRQTDLNDSAEEAESELSRLDEELDAQRRAVMEATPVPAAALAVAATAEAREGGAEPGAPATASGERLPTGRGGAVSEPGSTSAIPMLATRADDGSAEWLAARLAAYLHACRQHVRLEALCLEAARLGPEPGSSAAAPYTPAGGPQERLAYLRARHAELLAAHPELESSPLHEGSRGQLERQLAEVARRREELRVRRVNLFAASDRAIEQWRAETPRLRGELARLEELRGELLEFREALEIARTELETISQQVFRQWAAALNERINEALPQLNARYTDVRISNELTLSAHSIELGRRLEHRDLPHLSKGARDQLNLALRVSMSEYLSSHVGALPLVFDEPFAHWDDDRFVEGMRYLANLSERHQVLMLTCHRSRMEHLRETAPEVWHRLHLCELTQ